MPFAATWMNLEITILSEHTNELIYKTEIEETQKTNIQLPKG